MTDLERWIQRVNETRGISQEEKQRLRQLGRDRANARGEFGPADRDVLNQALRQAQGTEPASGGPNPAGGSSGGGSGSGGSGSGGSGGGGRPPRPGAAWVWSNFENRWVKPDRPGYDSSMGSFTWNDEQGWVWVPRGSGSPSPPPGSNPPPTAQPPTDPGDDPNDGTDPNDPNDLSDPNDPNDSGESGSGGSGSGDSEPDPFEQWQQAQEQERRTSASSFFRGLLGQYGFSPSDTDSLMSMFDNWLAEGFNNDAIMMKFRGTEIYTKRFPGMKALSDRGQAISEGEYIRLESSYRAVLSSYGLPKEFFDSPDDYGAFIANNVSPDEVDERAATGQRILQSADKRILAELGEYYGVNQGTALAYLLDANKAQDLIRRQVRAATIGGSGERFGFKMQRDYSEKLGSTSLGQTIDGMSPEAAARLDQSFTTARRVADREKTLASIDSEAFKDLDAVDAMFGDLGKQLASQARAKRERARFLGTSGIGASSLSQERNF